MHLALVALSVMVAALAIGAIMGYFMPGRSRKKRWYSILISICAVISLLFSLGAYVFTQNSIFYFASSQVGIMTFEYSIVTFIVLISLFVMGLWIGDVIEHSGESRRHSK